MVKSFSRGLLALGGLAALSSGCVYVAATPSVQGHAYVVKASPFGSTFWNCDATTGKPVCYQVVKAAPSAAAATQGD